MPVSGKAVRIDLFSFKTVPMRAFHMTWLAFFLCFFGWFGIAPLMPVVRQEFALTKAQIGHIMIASVAVTVLARLLFGWICDRVGPRKAYTWLLILGALPIIGIGFSNSYATFLLFRLAIGAIGASFVITQHHTSTMFASNVVGTANATTAGWGNAGGGVTQMVMPMILAVFTGLGASAFWGWRLAMIVPGVALLLAGVAYYAVTKDTPEGNVSDLRRAGRLPPSAHLRGAFREACTDPRVWLLAVMYGACFGIELTIHNIAALYFTDYFHLNLKTAGLVAGTFGVLAIFARTLGGWLGDRWGRRWGLRGRSLWLLTVLFGEGLMLILFSRMTHLGVAIAAMAFFGFFVHMSAGATYAIVPFINKRALGSVAGIVGAGGNLGAVAAGFLFSGGLAWPTALLILGVIVTACSTLALGVRFSEAHEREVNAEWGARLQEARRGSHEPAKLAAS